jgi:hypothetical protein
LRAMSTSSRINWLFPRKTMNDNKTREEQMAAATAHYLRMAAELFRAKDPADKHGRQLAAVLTVSFSTRQTKLVLFLRTSENERRWQLILRC